VCSDLEPAVAKLLGEGDLDPVTLLPMVDINPRYVPRVLKTLNFVENGVNNKGKGKAPSSGGGILSFFGVFYLFIEFERSSCCVQVRTP
jgi:exonuclease-1